MRMASRMLMACASALLLLLVAVAASSSSSPPTFDPTHSRPWSPAAVFARTVASPAAPHGLRVLSAASEAQLQALVEADLEASSSDAAATGTFDDTINKNGWSSLVIRTSTAFNDSAQAYAAGYLEAKLTSERIYELLYNLYGLQSPFSSGLHDYLRANHKWIKEQIKEFKHSDPYWHQVDLLYHQADGMFDGYVDAMAAHKHKQVDWWTFYAATLMGDMDDLCEVFGCNRERVGDGHCSVLIKPTADKQELFVGHVTWNSFTSMTRIYKHYDFPYTMGAGQSATVPARHMAFPSYPGALYSVDDWYQTDAGLAITETTIVNNNATLYHKYVKPSTVLDWARNMVANRITSTGQDWVGVFARYNSGTYNNQFMIVDYKLFTPGQPLQPGLLWVLEQMPGYIVARDQTGWLVEHGYWASYNRPFYPEIWAVSNQAEKLAKHGDHYSWNMTARAQIFRARQAAVTTPEQYGALMRHNDFTNEIPIIGHQGCKSGPSGSNAISERGDLTKDSSGCISDVGHINEAGTDCKYTTAAMMRTGKLTAMAQSGPTYDQQPPFQWSESPFAHKRHIGHPDKWQFPWVKFEWDL